MILIPKPPKDYVLTDVPRSLLHDEVFTPGTEPRVTQPTLGKHLRACEYGLHENPSPSDQQKGQDLHPRVLDKWVKDAKALYVDKPGKNDYFLHELYHKFNRYDPSRELDDRWKMRNKLFPRSYKYELHCLRYFDVKRLRKKNQLEKEVDDEKLEAIRNIRFAGERLAAYEAAKPPECQAAPFWWKKNEEGKETVDPTHELRKLAFEQGPEINLEEPPEKRWHQPPKLFSETSRDLCLHRLEMSRVGQPFASDACKWYYENFPPPKIGYIKKPLGS